MLKKYATSSTAAFSGQGQTLGGDPAAPDVVGEVKGSLDSLAARFSALDPQAKVLLGLLGLYVVFWFF
jgi:thioredoxin 1